MVVVVDHEPRGGDGIAKPSPPPLLSHFSKNENAVQDAGDSQTYRQHVSANNKEEMRRRGHSSSTAMLIIVDNIPTTPLPGNYSCILLRPLAYPSLL